MDSPRPGDLVSFDTGGPTVDAIVFDVPSHTKVVIALVDPTRGPGFRTVHPETLSEREGEGPDDTALRRLMRRTPLPEHGAARAGRGSGHGRSGHRRAAMHRTTGK